MWPPPGAGTHGSPGIVGYGAVGLHGACVVVGAWLVVVGACVVVGGASVVVGGGASVVGVGVSAGGGFSVTGGASGAGCSTVCVTVCGAGA